MQDRQEAVESIVEITRTALPKSARERFFFWKSLDRVFAHFRQIAVAHRRIAVLEALDSGSSQTEIAKTLDIPVDTVYNDLRWCHEHRKELREKP